MVAAAVRIAAGALLVALLFPQVQVEEANAQPAECREKKSGSYYAKKKADAGEAAGFGPEDDS